ncbi:MAG TPA: ATP-binding cassette domain-containing protein, partial [Xanthobacteraceae bacterium]|nr:ATP-binding cassette domain-containing protein [Xanthobacteraceae bacterium]
ENAEQIALMGGETAERERLMDRFRALVGNWLAIMSRTKKLTFFTAGFTQASIVFPYFVAGPAYFANLIDFGGLQQTAQAFNQVQTAFSFFIEAYGNLAEWSSVIIRLSGFAVAIKSAESVAKAPPVIALERDGKRSQLDIAHLKVNLPQGRPLVDAEEMSLSRGDRTLVMGPTGSGKSTLFRAIGGIWPFGSGTITIPHNAKLLVLPQRPYLPIGSLLAAISYPAVPNAFAPDKVSQVLVAVGMPGYVSRLYEEAHWNRMLSLGEQQRLAVARAILHAPDYLLLDEATASLDEASEAELYRLLNELLPGTAILSIGHRATLRRFHQRLWQIVREGDRQWVRERKLEPAE